MVYMGKPFLLSSFLIDVIHDLLRVVKGLLSQRNATCEIRCCKAQQFRLCATPRTPPPTNSPAKLVTFSRHAITNFGSSVLPVQEQLSWKIHF